MTKDETLQAEKRKKIKEQREADLKKILDKERVGSTGKKSKKVEK